MCDKSSMNTHCDVIIFHYRKLTVFYSRNQFHRVATPGRKNIILTYTFSLENKMYNGWLKRMKFFFDIIFKF